MGVNVPVWQESDAEVRVESEVMPGAAAKGVTDDMAGVGASESAEGVGVVEKVGIVVLDARRRRGIGGC